MIWNAGGHVHVIMIAFLPLPPSPSPLYRLDFYYSGLRHMGEGRQVQPWRDGTQCQLHWHGQGSIGGHWWTGLVWGSRRRGLHHPCDARPGRPVPCKSPCTWDALFGASPGFCHPCDARPGSPMPCKSPCNPVWGLGQPAQASIIHDLVAQCYVTWDALFGAWGSQPRLLSHTVLPA